MSNCPRSAARSRRARRRRSSNPSRRRAEVYAPVAGEVVAVNDALDGAPGTVNEDAEGNGWFFKLKVADLSQIEGLMTEDQYQAFLETIE